jgi:probable F420-dependent oxidoreductase
VDNRHTPIGRIGIWTAVLDAAPAPLARELVGELESLGYGAVWAPETVGPEAMSRSAILLAGSERIVVGTGIASIWARHPAAAHAAHLDISEAFPGRFLLGLGVSHAPMVSGLLGEDYSRPRSAMRTYLDRMDSSLYFGPQPSVPPQRVLAALGPRMLALAAEKANGALTYFVPPEHTVVAREALGDEPLLAVEQAVVLETDPTRAREIARAHTSLYVTLSNYTNNLQRFGMTDDDLPDGGSDRLVDTVVAWGDLDALVARVRAHLDAGADHVCLQVLGDDLVTPPHEAWRLLADALIG